MVKFIMASTTFSGMKVEGEWNDVVETSREVSRVLEDSGLEEEIDEWEYWRPREDERYDRELIDKTAEVSCTSRNSLEKSDREVGEEAKDGLKKVKKALENDEGGEDLKEGVKKFYLSADTVARRMVRNFEKFVFKNVISKTNPQFFDSDVISANITKKSGLKDKLKGKENDEYVLEINVSDSEIQEKVIEKIDSGEKPAG